MPIAHRPIAHKLVAWFTAVVRKPLAVASVAFFCAFFFPWLDMGSFKVSGWGIPGSVKQMHTVFSPQAASVTGWHLLYLYPLLAGLTFGAAIWGRFERVMAWLTAASACLFFFVMFLYVGANAIYVFGFGVYFSVASAGYMLIGCGRFGNRSR